MVVHGCNLSVQEANEDRALLHGSLGLHSKDSISKKKKKNQKGKIIKEGADLSTKKGTAGRTRNTL